MVISARDVGLMELVEPWDEVTESHDIMVCESIAKIKIKRATHTRTTVL